MNRNPKKASRSAEMHERSIKLLKTWKLEEAKAKFSEVVRLAHDQGPQYVTVRGKPAVAVVDIAELERWMPVPPGYVALVDFLEGLDVADLDLSREPDVGRDIEL